MEEYVPSRPTRECRGKSGIHGWQIVDDASSGDCPAHQVKRDDPQFAALQQALTQNQAVEVAVESVEASRSDCTDSQLELVLRKRMGYSEDA